MRDGLGDCPEPHRLEKSSLSPRSFGHPDIETSRFGGTYAGDEPRDVTFKPERTGDVIRGADWQDRDRGRAVAQAASNPRHCAVAAGDDDKIPVLVKRFAVAIVLSRLVARRKAGGTELLHELIGGRM